MRKSVFFKIFLLLSIVGFPRFAISLDPKFTKFFIKERDIFLKENEQVMLSFVQDIEIDSRGNIWIIDWNTSELFRFDGDGGSPTLIAKKGKGPGELILPQRIFIDQNDHVFVANFGSRVTEFDAEGNYLNSFIATDGHFPTNCIAVNSEGFILIGGPRRKWEGNSLTGEIIHVYSPKGDYLRSFCRMDENVGRKNLERYCAVHFDLDKNDNIYTVQPVNFLITVFDKNGNYIKCFGERQRYYKEPKLLTEEIEHDKRKMENYRKNFTYVKDIFVFNGKVAVLSRNYPGLKGNRFRYFIDIYECEDGRLIAGGIESDKNLYAVRGDKFYFFRVVEKKTGEIQNIIEVYRFREDEK